MTLVWTIALGVIGIVARFRVDEWVLKHVHTSFPVSTFAINVTGSFLAGLIFALSARLPAFVGQSLLVGLCGGFTTFSAYSVQSFHLLQRGQVGTGMIYLFLSPALGVVAAYLGMALGKGLP